MKIIKYSLLFIVMMALSGCGETITETTFVTEPPPAGTITDLIFNATVIGDTTRTAKVYLPNGYDASRAAGYPVVYQLHGIGGDENTWPTGKDLAQLLDRMIFEGVLEATIVVMPSASNALGGGFYTNSFDHDLSRNPTSNEAFGFGKYEALITAVLIPTAEATYNIDSAKRGIMGNSMGGYGAMKLALLHPEMFVSVASHSGPLAFAQLFDAATSNILARISAELKSTSSLPFLDFDKAGENIAGNPLTLTMLGIVSSFSPHFGPLTGFDTFLWQIGLDSDPTDNFQYPIVQVSDGGTPLDPLDDIYLGVDLVMTFDSDTMAVINQDIFNLTLDQDVYSMLETVAAGGEIGLYPDFGATQIAGFSALNIYFDTGEQDDFDPSDDFIGFGIIAQHKKFKELMDMLGMTYTSATYTGAHSDGVYTRIDEAYSAFNTAIGN